MPLDMNRKRRLIWLCVSFLLTHNIKTYKKFTTHVSRFRAPHMHARLSPAAYTPRFLSHARGCRATLRRKNQPPLWWFGAGGARRRVTAANGDNLDRDGA